MTDPRLKSAFHKSESSKYLALTVPYLMGNGVVQAVEECGLIPVAIFGTMALCRPPTQFTKRADPLGANYYE